MDAEIATLIFLLCLVTAALVAIIRSVGSRAVAS
jgi:hypothetical protein